MKQITTHVLFAMLGILMMISRGGHAQSNNILAGWNFTTPAFTVTANSGGAGYQPAPTLDPLISYAGVGRGSGNIATPTVPYAKQSYGAYPFADLDSTAAIAGAHYMLIKVKASLGSTYTVDSLNFYYQEMGSGPKFGNLQYAVGTGSFTTLFANLTFTQNNVTTQNQVRFGGLAGRGLTNLSGSDTLVFRLVLWAAAGTTSAGSFWFRDQLGSAVTNNSINDITIKGSASAAATCSAVAGSIISSAPNPVCGTGSSTLSLTGNSTTNIVYQWRASTDNINWTNVGSNASAYSTGSISNTMYYKAVLSCTNSSSKDSTQVFTYTVNPILTPSVTVSSTPGNTICAGTSVTFSATAANGGASPAYQWMKNGSPVGSNNASYTDNALLNNDVIYVTLTSNATCASTPTVSSLSRTLTVNPILTPSISFSATPGATLCAGTLVTFSATAGNGGTAPTYQWLKNNTPVGSSLTYTDNTLANGDAVSVILTSNATCASSSTVAAATLTMTVIPSVTPAITLTAMPGGPVCAGTSVTFSATTSNGGSTPQYQWIKGVTPVGTNSAGYTDNTLINGDVITVLLISNATCASTPTALSTPLTLTVNPVVTPAVTLTFSPASPICAGTVVSFTATGSNGGSVPAYQWLKNNNPVGSGSPVYTDNTLASGDVVSVVLTSNAACVSSPTVSNSSASFSVNPVVVPSATIHATPGTTITAGTTVTFTAATANAGTSPSYQWYVNGNPVSTTATYTSNTLQANDVVSLRLTSSAPCALAPASSNSLTITYSVATGITALPEAAISLNLFPNPGTGTFCLQGSLGAEAGSEVSIELFNAIGTLVYKSTAAPQQGRLDATLHLGDAYANGAYLLSVRSGQAARTLRLVLNR